jgi:hypothetical protein
VSFANDVFRCNHCYKSSKWFRDNQNFGAETDGCGGVRVVVNIFYEDMLLKMHLMSSNVSCEQNISEMIRSI